MTIPDAQEAASHKTGAVLDVAESGYYVYLVEQSPAIGGEEDYKI